MPEAREDVLHKILVPFRLFSKARQYTADLVWELIAQSPLPQFNLLAGCAEVWAAEKGNGKKEDEGEGEATERMARINEAMAEKLAVCTRALCFIRICTADGSMQTTSSHRIATVVTSAT
jgi:hypothetical protein